MQREIEVLKQERDILKKSTGHLLARAALSYRFIREQKREYPVSRICQVLGVSVSGYYAWHKCPVSPHELANRELARHQIYGSPRIHAELKARGQACSLGCVARLMRLHGIRARRRRR